MTGDSILVLNAGSSSLKFSLFRTGATDRFDLVVRGEVEGLGARPRLTVRDGTGATVTERNLPAGDAREPKDAIGLVGGWLRDQPGGVCVVAVGHRVVHGGATFSEPTLVDDRVCEKLERLLPLAPLHQPHNLAAIRAVRAWRPDLPQVACFDTSFHRSHPVLADLYALPWEYHEAGVRRYGFHGLSYEYVASVLPRVAPDLAQGRVVVAHLGSGASLCAMQRGRSVDCTMGFSALDGVPMGTRPGALDPGVVLYLLTERGMSAKEVERMLYHDCGLLGLSGVSNDMRRLLESPEPRAQLAIDYFVRCVARAIGSLAASLGGLDGLVFTAGIGENSAPIRARIIDACAWLGMRLDADANEGGGPRVSAAGSAVSAWVVPTNEELMIARHTAARIGRA
ncbi:MAG: acetate/propionate family kinase [Candidatus Binatia bacterium]